MARKNVLAKNAGSASMFDPNCRKSVEIGGGGGACLTVLLFLIGSSLFVLHHKHQLVDRYQSQSAIIEKAAELTAKERLGKDLVAVSPLPASVLRPEHDANLKVQTRGGRTKGVASPVLEDSVSKDTNATVAIETVHQMETVAMPDTNTKSISDNVETVPTANTMESANDEAQVSDEAMESAKDSEDRVEQCSTAAGFSQCSEGEDEPEEDSEDPEENPEELGEETTVEQESSERKQTETAAPIDGSPDILTPKDKDSTNILF